ncbi:MAG TPA: Coenzyme F420 hydrogenase/dehydrogenase, beta subunit C-terminal domain [Candidatus Deferrimicrobiaceae bacterium]|jgi:coenzyme F420 hydrogenase subunit beta
MIGHASAPDIRYRGSSGGLLSALALYCLENENVDFVLQTATDPIVPWKNRTVFSRTREELLSAAGSRYVPSSPCAAFSDPEMGTGKFVFIGKPCDVAAFKQLKEIRPELAARNVLTLTFFCAGTPSERGTLDLIRSLGISCDQVDQLRYRGEGWPGNFTIRYENGSRHRSVSYQESWGFIQKYRPFRCHLCPDGLGELADISCGDAWHRHGQDENPGLSFAMVRTERGEEILKKAMACNYLELSPANSEEMIQAQGLVNRRKEIHGRILALRLLGLPHPVYPGFHLSQLWKKNTTLKNIKTVAGTIKRILKKGYLHSVSS